MTGEGRGQGGERKKQKRQRRAGTKATVADFQKSIKARRAVVATIVIHAVV